MNSSFKIRYHHDIVTKPVKVNVTVKQESKVLYDRTIDLRCFFSPLQIDFEFNSLSPVTLVFETQHPDMDLYPLYIDRIEFDDLIDIPFVAHRGKLISLDAPDDTTNCLYRSGKLTYTFTLPLCSNAKIL